MKTFKNILFIIITLLCLLFVESKCIKKHKCENNIADTLNVIKSPYVNKLGLCFSVEQAQWFVSPKIVGNKKLLDLYTYQRLNKVTNDFKLIRIYQFLVAGWEQTGNLCPEAEALVRVVKSNPSIEAVIGTSNNMVWYSDTANTNLFIRKMKSKFGTSIKQVKTIMVGNEVNCVANFNSNKLYIILSNFKSSLKTYGLNIPVTVSFNNLPIQSGDTLSDNFVSKVVKNWDKNWNSGYPFVFIDPYPDAEGINNAKGVYAWQNNVTKYYRKKYPKINIFIAETGAEGSLNDTTTVKVVNSIFNVLDSQYSKYKNVVPTFIFECADEKLKYGSPNQQNMGIYQDTSAPQVIKMTLKKGINLPSFVK